MNVGDPLRLANYPAHAVGQFFHFQCIQLRLPNIPGNPRCWPMVRSIETSSVVGDLGYQSEKTATIARQNLFMHSIAVNSHVLMYSLVASVGMPYAKIRIEAVTLCRVDNPSLPDASRHWLKSLSCCLTT